MDERFLERMGSHLAGWSDPVERLRGALDRDEFQLFCQPILALNDEASYPLGEVLVRQAALRCSAVFRRTARIG